MYGNVCLWTSLAVGLSMLYTPVRFLSLSHLSRCLYLCPATPPSGIWGDKGHVFCWQLEHEPSPYFPPLSVTRSENQKTKITVTDSVTQIMMYKFPSLLSAPFLYIFNTKPLFHLFLHPHSNYFPFGADNYNNTWQKEIRACTVHV